MLSAATVSAEVFPLGSPEMRNRPHPQSQDEWQKSGDSWLPDPKDERAVRAYLKKRFEEVSHSIMDKDTDLNNSIGVDIVHSAEYLKAQEEQNKKGLFQTFYEKALASLGGKLPDSGGI